MFGMGIDSIVVEDILLWGEIVLVIENFFGLKDYRVVGLGWGYSVVRWREEIE